MVDPRSRAEDELFIPALSPADLAEMREVQALQASHIAVTETSERIRYLDDQPESIFFDPGFWLMVICILAAVGVVANRLFW